MRIRVKTETCPKCGSTIHENYVRVATGEPIKVYVVCAKCKSFVARYQLARYTSDKPYEALLDIAHRVRTTDGRRVVRELEAFTKSIEEEFKLTMELAQTQKETRKLEEIIEELGTEQ